MDRISSLTVSGCYYYGDLYSTAIHVKRAVHNFSLKWGEKRDEVPKGIRSHFLRLREGNKVREIMIVPLASIEM